MTARRLVEDALAAGHSGSHSTLAVTALESFDTSFANSLGSG